MAGSRLDQLLKFYEEDPSDPFNLYGLALEYLKNDVNKSKQMFDRLLNEFPDYIPTYYHAAKLYVELNEKENAIKIYKQGIERSSKLQDTKANRELKSAYEELTFGD
jgi:tetratricopeptide (TPR) repeat protein